MSLAISDEEMHFLISEEVSRFLESPAGEKKIEKLLSSCLMNLKESNPEMYQMLSHQCSCVGDCSR